MSGLSRFTSSGSLPSSSPVIDSMNSINVTPSLVASRRSSKQAEIIQGKYSCYYSPVIDSMNSINVTPSLVASRRSSKQAEVIQGKSSCYYSPVIDSMNSINVTRASLPVEDHQNRLRSYRVNIHVIIVQS